MRQALSRISSSSATTGRWRWHLWELLLLGKVTDWQMEKQTFKIGLLYITAHGQNHSTAVSCLFSHHVCSKLNNCGQVPGRTPASRSKTRASGWSEERRGSVIVRKGDGLLGERHLNLLLKMTPSSTGKGGQNSISKSKGIWTERVNSRDSWRPMKMYGINERTF